MNNDTNNQSSNNNSTSTSNSKSPQKNSNNDWCEASCCVNPIDIFTIASALSLLFYKELNLCQLNTLLNLLTLVSANLDAYLSQVEINKGNIVQPPFIEPL